MKDIMFIGQRRQSELAISPHDRAFLLGDGCFETLRYAEGKIDGVCEHLGLLQKSASVLGIAGFPDDVQLEAALSEVSTGLVVETALRITVSRGSGGRGAESGGAEPVSIISASPPAQARPYPPLRVITSSIRRNQTSPLSRIKSTSYGENLAARREAAAAGADEALMLNMAGRPACLAMGNIFLRTQDGVWVTPPEEEGVRAGYMRAQVIAQLSRDGLPLEIRPLRAEALVDTRVSLFGVNSLWGMRAIETLDGRNLPLVSSVL